MLSKKRGPGRPATGSGTLIGVRLGTDLLGPLDEFRANDPRGLNRPQAIRVLMKMMLGAPRADRSRRVQELLDRPSRYRDSRAKIGAAQ